MLPIRLLPACLALVLAAAPALAQDQELPPVYFGAEQEAGGRTVVKFVFSRRSAGAQAYEPTHAYRIAPTWAPRKCNVERTSDFRIADEYSRSPLYDTATDRRQLSAERLPIFFATVVSGELARRGFAQTDEESLPFHACTRLFWEQVLGLNRK